MLKQQIGKAIDAHRKWKGLLLRAIETGQSDTDPDMVRQDDLCEFGRWLCNEVPNVHRQNEQYEVVFDLHHRFHGAASNVLEVALAGDSGAARKLMAADSVYTTTSTSLLFALQVWRDSAEVIS